MTRHAAMQNLTAVVAQDEKTIEQVQSHRRDGEEVHRGDGFPVIPQKGHPSLGWVLSQVACEWQPPMLLKPEADRILARDRGAFSIVSAHLCRQRRPSLRSRCVGAAVHPPVDSRARRQYPRIFPGRWPRCGRPIPSGPLRSPCPLAVLRPAPCPVPPWTRIRPHSVRADRLPRRCPEPLSRRGETPWPCFSWLRE